MLLLNAIHEAARRSQERPGELWAIWTNHDDDPSNSFRFRAGWWSGDSNVEPAGVVLTFRNGRYIPHKLRTY